MAIKKIPIKTKLPIDFVNESHWKHLPFVEVDTEFSFDDNDLAVNVVNNITNNINNQYGVLSVASVSDLANIDTSKYFDVVHVKSFHNHRIFGINETYGGGLFQLVNDSDNQYLQSGLDLQGTLSFRSNIDINKSWIRIIEDNISIESFGCKDKEHIQPFEYVGYDFVSFLVFWNSFFGIRQRPTLTFERKNYYQNSNSNIQMYSQNIDFQNSKITFENYTSQIFIGGANLSISNLTLFNLTPNKTPDSIFYVNSDSTVTNSFTKVDVYEFPTTVCRLGSRTNFKDCNIVENQSANRIYAVFISEGNLDNTAFLENCKIQTNSIFTPTNDEQSEICLFLLFGGFVTLNNCNINIGNDMPIFAGSRGARAKIENSFIDVDFIVNNLEGISQISFVDCAFRYSRLLQYIGKYNTITPILPLPGTVVLPSTKNAELFFESCIMPYSLYVEYCQSVTFDNIYTSNVIDNPNPNVIHCAICDSIVMKNTNISVYSNSFIDFNIEDCRNFVFSKNSLSFGIVRGLFNINCQTEGYTKAFFLENVFLDVDFNPNQQGFINLNNAKLIFKNNYIKDTANGFNYEFIVSNHRCFISENNFEIDRLQSQNFFIECFDVSNNNGNPTTFLEIRNNDFIIINAQQGVTDFIGLDSQNQNIFFFCSNRLTANGEYLSILHATTKNNIVQNNIMSPKPFITDVQYFEFYNNQVGLSQSILDAQSSTPYLHFGNWFMY